MITIKTYPFILSAVMIFMTACSYTNHFLDEEGLDPSAPYRTMADLDATAYDSWTYIHLETGEIEKHKDSGTWYYTGTEQTKKEQTTEEVGINWHIAVHRYEIKTNNGSAVNTHIPDIENVIALPDGKYEEDETVNYFTESAVEGTTPYLLVMDMSGMMDGNIGYALDGQINRVLCDAVTRTETGGMPPVLYGTTGEVLAIKYPDGDWAAIKITKTYGGSDGARSGMMSFQYKFHKSK